MNLYLYIFMRVYITSIHQQPIHNSYTRIHTFCMLLPHTNRIHTHTDVCIYIYTQLFMYICAEVFIFVCA